MISHLLELVDEPYTRHQHSIVVGRAALAEARLDLEEAARLYSDAEQRWKSYSCLVEEGQAAMAAARCMVTMERVDEARPSLDRAMEIFGGLHAEPLAEEVNLLRARLVGDQQ
jgi:hypothetical protein